MKMKKTITLTLLFVIAFSALHSYIFSLHENHHHHSVVEYVADLDTPNTHDELCNIHFKFHQSFVLPTFKAFHLQPSISLKISAYKESYNFFLNIPFFKPPIV